MTVLKSVLIYDGAVYKTIEEAMTIVMQDDTITDTVTEVKVKLEKPKKYHVIFINDDFTSTDFVVYVLMSIFNKNKEEATALMSKVHDEGRAIVATYNREIAEQKVYETMETAKLNEFPLQAIIEEEDPN